MAALEVFAARGYAETAMEHIAAHAAVTRSVLYDHFTSKKDLYVTLLRRQRDEVMAHVRSAAGAEAEPEKLFRAALESFFSFVREHPITWRMLFHDYVGDPEVMAAHTEAQAEASLAMAQALVGQSPAFPKMRELERPQQEILAHLWGAGLNAVARWWHEHPDVPQQVIIEMAVLALWPGLRQLAPEEYP